MSRKMRSPDDIASKTPPAPEFSRPIELAELSPGGQRFEIEANEAERKALARRFELQALDSLVARVRVAPLGAALGVRVEGHLEATVTQRCVVSLEPFETQIDEAFGLELRPMEAIDDAPEHYRDDDVEPLEGPTLDLGELVAQHLSLALDPHPRKPGATLEDGEFEDSAKPDRAANPFAVLGDLKCKM